MISGGKKNQQIFVSSAYMNLSYIIILKKASAKSSKSKSL